MELIFSVVILLLQPDLLEVFSTVTVHGERRKEWYNIPQSLKPLKRGIVRVSLAVAIPAHHS